MIANTQTSNTVPLPNYEATRGLGAIFPAPRRSARSDRAPSASPGRPAPARTSRESRERPRAPAAEERARSHARSHPTRSGGTPPPIWAFSNATGKRGRVARRQGSAEWGTKSTAPRSGPRGMLQQPFRITQHFERRSYLGSTTYRCPAPHRRSRGRRRRARKGRARPAASAGAAAARHRGGRGATAWPMSRRPAAHMRRGPAGSAAPQPLRATARAQRRRMKEPQRRGAGRGGARTGCKLRPPLQSTLLGRLLGKERRAPPVPRSVPTNSFPGETEVALGQSVGVPRHPSTTLEGSAVASGC